MPLLLDLLIQRFPTAKRTTLKRMVEDGRVVVNGQAASRLKLEVSADATIDIHDTRQPLAASRRAATPQATFPIVYEDADILVVNKPPGLLTSTVPREPRPTLVAMVRDYVRQRETRARVGLIHRLDRDAAGLLVFSKNHEAYQSLKTQFFNHSVERIYMAVVQGSPQPPQDTIRTRLVELPEGKVVSTQAERKGQIAVTEYTVVARGNGRSMLRVKLQTGRKHQIRCQLSERGWPIVGDPMYGNGSTSDSGLMLTAAELSLTHPRSRKRLTFEVPIPEAMKCAIRADTPTPGAQRSDAPNPPRDRIRGVARLRTRRKGSK